jgi:hypothetical protein
MIYLRIPDIPVFVLTALIGIPLMLGLLRFWIQNRLNPGVLFFILFFGVIAVSVAAVHLIWNYVKRIRNT